MGGSKCRFIAEVRVTRRHRVNLSIYILTIALMVMTKMLRVEDGED